MLFFFLPPLPMLPQAPLADFTPLIVPMTFCRKRHHFTKTNREFLCHKAAPGGGGGGDVSCSLASPRPSVSSGNGGTLGGTGGAPSPCPSPWVLLSLQSSRAGGERGFGGRAASGELTLCLICSCRSMHIRSGKFLLFPSSFLGGGEGGEGYLKALRCYFSLDWLHSFFSCSWR